MGQDIFFLVASIFVLITTALGKRSYWYYRVVAFLGWLSVVMLYFEELVVK